MKADKEPKGVHKKRLRTPTTNEIAIVMVNEENSSRHIIIQKRNNSLLRVNETHRSYDALQYPLLFWQGANGSHFKIMQIGPKKDAVINKKVIPFK